MEHVHPLCVIRQISAQQDENQGVNNKDDTKNFRQVCKNCFDTGSLIGTKEGFLLTGYCTGKTLTWCLLQQNGNDQKQACNDLNNRQNCNNHEKINLRNMVKQRQRHGADWIRFDNNAIISHVGQIFKDRIQFFVGEEQAAAEKHTQTHQCGKHKIQLMRI